MILFVTSVNDWGITPIYSGGGPFPKSSRYMGWGKFWRTNFVDRSYYHLKIFTKVNQSEVIYRSHDELLVTYKIRTEINEYDGWESR